MKATELFKLYATEAEAEIIRRKCAKAGVSASRAGVSALLHWQPKRTGIVGRGGSPSRGANRGTNFMFPGRAAMPMRL